MIIARSKELARFRALETSERSEFVAVYGRRRVGKTFLIREAYENKFLFQHAGLANANRQAQLFEFTNSLREAGLKSFAPPKNWLEAFSLLKQLIKENNRPKKIVFIDELSWMDTPKCDLITAIESFWNGWASARKDIILIVCASATSWMMKKVIHARGGLHNRLTERIALKPFNLNECMQYAQAYNLPYSQDTLLEAYMIFGGVPYYWSLMKSQYSLAQNVDHLCFGEDAPLGQEFDYMYSALFKYPQPYTEVVEALATKKVGMLRTEILEALNKKTTGDLTDILDDLESCGIIRSYCAFGKKKKDSTYQLMDNFTLFHFKYIASRPTDKQFWSHQYNQASTNTWRGLAFERVCLWHHEQIKQKLGISGILTNTSSWACRADTEKNITGAQIDLVIDRNDKLVSLCEIKYSTDTYVITPQYAEQLRNKINSFVHNTGTRKGTQLVMICNNGLAHNANSSIAGAVITAADLFCPEW